MAELKHTTLVSAAGQGSLDDVEGVEIMVRNLIKGSPPRYAGQRISAIMSLAVKRAEMWCQHTSEALVPSLDGGEAAKKMVQVFGAEALQAKHDTIKKHLDTKAADLYSMDDFKVFKQFRWLCSESFNHSVRKLMGLVANQMGLPVAQDDEGNLMNCSIALPSQIGLLALPAQIGGASSSASGMTAKQSKEKK